MSAPAQILSTRRISDELIDYASKFNIHIHVVPFIKTEPLTGIETQQEIEQAVLLQTTVIFTSINAVEAVNALMDGEQVLWKIYCVGHTTREQAAAYFGEGSIQGIADNAEDLADLIIKDGITEEAIFFCGNLRRETLPEILAEAKIIINEVRVYETVFIPRKITRFYNGILFFSPSAAESFFSVNTLPEGTIIFAIGNTTGNEVMKFTKNKLIVATSPSAEQMIQDLIEYFN